MANISELQVLIQKTNKQTKKTLITLSKDLMKKNSLVYEEIVWKESGPSGDFHSTSGPSNRCHTRGRAGHPAAGCPSPQHIRSTASIPLTDGTHITPYHPQVYLTGREDVTERRGLGVSTIMFHISSLTCDPSISRANPVPQ